MATYRPTERPRCTESDTHAMHERLLNPQAFVNVVAWHCLYRVRLVSAPLVREMIFDVTSYDVTRVSVSLSVCMDAYVRTHFQEPSPPNFLCVLPAGVARSSTGGVAICFVLPV